MSTPFGKRLNFDLFIKLMEHSGIAFIVAGGYPRDLYVGKEPKDLDIFVVDMNAVERMLYSVNITYVPCPYYSDDENDYRIKRVIKIGNIDIIECNERCENPINQVLDYFDFNINQFVLINGIPTFVGENYGTLERCSDVELPEQRINHIKNKAIERGWDVKIT